MDELIILLIAGLAKLFGGDKTRRPAPPQGAAWKPPIPTVPQPQQAAGGRAMSGRPVKRKVQLRRSPAIPVAAPIITASNAVQAAPAIVPPRPATTATKPREAGSVDAAALRRWLTPQTLRRQYFLTEILQPPLALRGEQERR